MASMMQVRYKLRDYYKEASEKYRLEVNSRGQHLSVPGCDENSPIRPQYDLLEPLTDRSASDLTDSLVLREALCLYEEKLQFGLDGYNILPINYERVSMNASIEPTFAEMEVAESKDYLHTHGLSRTLAESFVNELKPIHIQAEFPAFTESEIYGDMAYKSYEPQVIRDTSAILDFGFDTSQSFYEIEVFEYPAEYHKKGFSSLEKLLGPRAIVDLSPQLESRYTEHLCNISFLQDEDAIIDTASLSHTTETDLLDVSLEFNNAPYLDQCETFAGICPVNVVSKFVLKELKVLDNAFREVEERSASILQEFESRLWDDEIAFHDPTVKPLKAPIIPDDSKRSFRLRDLLRQVRFELVHTMQLELDLKSYWQREGLDKYRSSIEFDTTEYKTMDVDNDEPEMDLNEVFDRVPGFSTNTLIGDKTDVSYIEFQLNKIKEENTDEDSRYLKSLKDKTESCIDYNDNCKGLIYNYISMVESLPSVMTFSQVLDNLLPPDSVDRSFLHESISRCDTRSGPVTPVTNVSMNRSLQYNSPRPAKPPVAQPPVRSSAPSAATTTKQQARTPSILEEDPLLEYMKLRGVSVESTLPKSIWDRKYRLKSPTEGSYDEYKTSLAEVIRLSGQSVLLAPKSVALSQVILYLCYNIVSVMKTPVIWLCSDEEQSNNVMALVKPVLNEAVHLVSKGFAAPTVKQGEPALLIVNEQAVQGTVMKKSVLQQLSTAHMLFLDNTVNWEQPTSTAKEFMKLLPVSARVVLYSSIAPSSFQVFLHVLRDLKIDSIVSVLKTDADVKSSACLAEKIFVPLSDEIFRMLDVVSAFQQELISQIKETSVIELPEDRVLLSATQTKYLIDQLAQTIKDVPAGQSQGMSAMLVELMKLLVCAYVLAKADGYLVHYGILSAVHGLASAMQHPKYGKSIQEMLKDLHEELLRCQQEIDAGLFQTHPKINLFTRLVQDATSNRKNKCLIVIEHEQLGREIIVALNRSPETHLEIGTVTDNMNQSQLSNLVHANDIVIVPVTTLAKNSEFPYSYFAWVIEYEDYGLDISDKVNRATRHVKLITSRDESVHQNEANERLCEAWIKKLRSALSYSDKLSEVRTINITEFIAGKMNWPQSLYIGGLDLNEISESSITADITATERPESPSALIPIKVIIGEKLLQRRDLLSELQEKQRIELIERTLAFNEDIIIDDKTCVVIRKLSTLPNLVMQPPSSSTGQNNGKEKEQRKLLIELIKLALKYPAVWLLIEVDDDILQPQYQSALQEMQLWTVYFSNETQIRYGFSVKHLAQLIRRVCHHCAQNSTEWNGSLELWASRKWLLDDESKHELFLAKFPSMNPFRAQIILTLIELKEALGTSLDDLKQKFRWITPSALEYLDYALNYTKVAALEQTYPSPQRHQVPGVLRGQPLRAPANRLKRSYGEEEKHSDVERNAMKKRKTYAH